MKNKLLIILIALMTTTSTFATTDKGYKILSEEIHSAPGFNFHVEHTQGIDVNNQKKNLFIGQTTTNVPSRSGHVNDYITVDGYHTFKITNTTNRSQTYETYVSLDCEDLHSYYRRYVEVVPGGSFLYSDHSYGTVQKSSAGNYRISAETKLGGESSHASRDSNKLYVNR
jgi:hypothetical protein